MIPPDPLVIELLLVEAETMFRHFGQDPTPSKVQVAVAALVVLSLLGWHYQSRRIGGVAAASHLSSPDRQCEEEEP